MRLILAGFGVVGQGLARILRDKADELRRDHGFGARVVGVIANRKGSLYRSDGLDLMALLDAAEAGSFDRYADQPGLRRNPPVSDIIAKDRSDVLVEASPTNLETAQPALGYCHAALDAGMHIVLANKGPVALAHDELDSKARAKGLRMRCEATVMAGTPAMRLAREALAGCAISSARGILNGTTNFMLTRMERGMSYADALAEAQELGYAETDPSGDVDGWDAAGKVLILANALFGVQFHMSDLDVSGISAITSADIEEAKARGRCYKLIAEATPQGGMVRAQRLPLSDPLASVDGATNAITFETDLLGAVTLIGPGAGQRETGAALLADLLAIARERAPA